MKESGCVWSGTLDQLDTHLDTNLDCGMSGKREVMEDHMKICHLEEGRV